MYLALYRKYRPVSFDDVISQEHITTTLKNQIISGQIAHAYLFTGTRGTGKTTCAKIMARAVNCLSPVNGSPCGECAACKAISEGSTDIIEIDAASNNGVDSIRQIRDEVIYTPIDCKYKVYIIDEVHMLSGAAFNALLKTLEEPPPHVIFILATTEYYKVPVTILSRCQQFLFQKINPLESEKRLLEIAEKENISLNKAAAALIARLSDGAMRDALSLLDQCVSTGRDIDENVVRECSGAADSGYLFQISEAALQKSPPKALAVLDELIVKGKDLSRFIEELTSHYRNLMLVKSGGEGFVKADDNDIRLYKKQCGEYSLEEIMYHIDLISDSLDTINRMKQTGQARLLTEQLLIRLTTPKISRDVSAFTARLGAVEQRLDNIQKGLVHVGVKAESGEEKAETPVERKVEIKTEIPVEKKTEIPMEGKAEIKAEIPAEKAASKTEDAANKRNSDTNIPPASQGVKENAPKASGITQQDFAPPILEYGDYGADMDNENYPDYSEYPDIPPENFGNMAETYIPSEQETNDINPRIDAPAKNKNKAEKPAGVPVKQETVKAPIVQETEKTPVKQEPPKQDDSKKAAPKPEKAAPIGTVDFDLPDTAPIMPQWQEIISCLTPAARGVMTTAAAYLYDGKIYIRAGEAAATQLKRAAIAEKLRDAVTNVMGGRLEVYMLKEKSKNDMEKEDKIPPFLDKAASMGIKVTVNQK